MVHILGLLAGIAPFIAAIAFGIALAMTKTDNPPNLATWFMWAVLNGVITVSMFAAGNNQAWLPLGYAMGALFVSAILLSKGEWKWRYVESVCALGSALAMTLWYYSSAKWSVITAITAMWIASVPLFVDTWRRPNRLGWWIWAIGACSSLTAIIVAKEWSIAERAFPVSSVTFNATMAYLLFRKPIKTLP